MANHTTARRFKIKHNKSIGTVIIVVEGRNDEKDLLKRIFSRLLHYRVIHQMRGNDVITTLDRFVSKQNKNNQVVIVNTGGSNIASIKDFEEYRNKIYKELLGQFKIDTKNTPIYYLWDRDAKSNPSTITRTLLTNMGSAYDNKYTENGLLLLSYPAFEAYRLSCYEDTSSLQKQKLNKLKCQLFNPLSGISIEKVHYAIKIMHNTMHALGINEYSTEYFSRTNVQIFNEEEKIWKKNKMYRVLSLLSIILIDLGIIVEI